MTFQVPNIMDTEARRQYNIVLDTGALRLSDFGQVIEALLVSVSILVER